MNINSKSNQILEKKIDKKKGQKRFIQKKKN
jgi:hypothetical protein